MIANYLANKPSGAPAVYLIIAVVMFALAVVVVAAGTAITSGNGNTQKLVEALWRVLLSAGLGFLALALATH